MLFIVPSAMLQASFMHGGKNMANGRIESRPRLLNLWRIVGWSIPVILLILPAVAMHYTSEVDWSPADFVVMGAIFAIIGLGVEFLVRQSRSTAYRIASVVALVTAFFTIWVNAAVEMIGDDNPYNLLFGGVLMVGLGGSIIANFKAPGMARAMVAAAIAQALVAGGALSAYPRDAMFSMAFALPWLLSAALFRKAAPEA
jgi:hypothetical protein